MKQLIAFITGIFLIFFGFGLKDRGNPSSTPGVVAKSTEPEKKMITVSEYISPIFLVSGTVLLVGSIYLTYKNSQKGGRYD